MGKRARRRGEVVTAPAPARRSGRPRPEDRRKLLLVLGMALGSFGGLDTALREHFAGYRSHTTILAGLPCVVAAAALYFAGVPWPALLAAAAVVFAGVFWAARRAYMRRARRALRS